MAGKNNLAKALCVLIASSFVMVSCAPALTPAPTFTATPSKTPPPSATPTLTPSPTATATATPSPSQIAEMLGLPNTTKVNEYLTYAHMYNIEGNYLVDNHSNAIVATRSTDGNWQLNYDVNLKYLYWKDKLNFEPINFMNGTGGSFTHHNDSRFKVGDINVLFTGEMRSMELMTQNYGKVRDIQGLVVMPDPDAKDNVLEFWTSMTSFDFPGDIIFKRHLPDSRNRLDTVSRNEYLHKFKSGQMWRLNIFTQFPDYPVYVKKDCVVADHGQGPMNFCYDVFNMNEDLRMLHYDDTIRFVAGLNDEVPGIEVSTNFVLPADYISLLDNELIFK